MFRSTRVDFLVNAIDEIEQAHDILVGNDLVDPSYAAFYKDRQRGDHMPIIIGHQRQSCAVCSFFFSITSSTFVSDLDLETTSHGLA